MAHPKMYDDAHPSIRRLRKVCAAVPGAVEKEAWGECTFRVEGGSMFAMTNCHPSANGVVELWVKAPAMVQEILVGSAPETFFKPPYVGHKGWVGVRLDRKVDWKQVEEMLRDGAELSAPKTRRTAAARATRRPDPGGAGKAPRPVSVQSRPRRRPDPGADRGPRGGRTKAKS